MSHAIKVATYNIRKAVGLDQRRNPARILSVLKEIDANFNSDQSSAPLATARQQLIEKIPAL